MAREIIAHLDVAQESRDLSDEELSLRGELKRHSLGLASLDKCSQMVAQIIGVLFCA
jgi:hypothetical protein